MTTRLIERWLPIAALGIESVRERTPMTPFPAPNRLHVWWARRPLVASRAAVLASLLPAEADREQFMHMLGIHGDPVAAKRRIAKATRKGVRLGADAYGYPRAFAYSPDEKDRRWFAEAVVGQRPEQFVLLDPTAGGGSIPFESARLRLTTFANDLNPVAALILEATVEWPTHIGLEVLNRYDALGGEFLRRVKPKLAALFSSEPESDSVPDGYLWARTIRCPYCEGLIPLSPNWRLAPDGRGVRLVPDTGVRRCLFEIVSKASEHSEGTVVQGDARCPYPDCARVVDGDEVKRQAQGGEMGEQLYTVVYKRRVMAKTKTGREREKWERGFRAPRPEDDDADTLRQYVAGRLPEWETNDFVPTEAYGEMYADRSKIYGVNFWRDLFSPRQLICHVTSVEVFRGLLAEEEGKGALDGAARAAFCCLGLALDKLCDYNSRMTRWHSKREVVAGTFDRHDFSFKWSYAEMAPLVAGLGYDWAVKQIGKCIVELIEMVRPDLCLRQSKKHGQSGSLFATDFKPPPITVTCKSGDSLDHVADGLVDVVVMDPPYYDNVMYAELSDFFYVWLKRTAGYVYPELFRRQLTDKESEAVANPARHKGEKGAKARAARDYQERMAAIFAECRRVLKPEGVLTLMFTHKATGAWDALTSGLMRAGFTINASWPINTEAEGSLHIKGKAAANSTIFLVCRPRPIRAADETVYWEDVEPRVAEAVRGRIAEFEAAGIQGVDLYLACFGPALEEFARHWPLQRGTPKPEAKQRRGQIDFFEAKPDPYAVTPEDALDAARREVKAYRLDRLLQARRREEMDRLTEWFVLAWDAFRAPVFPYDEALRLAHVVGIDLDGDVVRRLAEKKGSDIVLWDSARRAAKGALGAPDGSRGMVDALHHAAHRARTQSVEAARQLLDDAGVLRDTAFTMALKGVLEVLPVSSAFTGVEDDDTPLGESARDFDALERLRRLAFTETIPSPQQLEMWSREAGQT